MPVPFAGMGYNLKNPSSFSLGLASLPFHLSTIFNKVLQSCASFVSFFSLLQ